MKCIATGSSGNTYALISNTNEILLLDLGASEKEIKVALDFNVAGIVGACVSHSHGDHSKSVANFEKMGIHCFTPYLDEPFQTKTCRFGNYHVTAFALDDKNCKQWQHTNSDGSECPIYGFYITHFELNHAFIYATDVKCIKWNFAKQHPGNILLGVDYQEDLLNRDFVKYEHQLEGHMSISTACDFIKANDNAYLQNIFIGHLSKSNACGEDFIEEMKKVTRKNVYVVTKGYEKILDNPFS